MTGSARCAAGIRACKGMEAGSVAGNRDGRDIEAGNANGNRFGKDMESCNAVDSSECKGEESGSRVGKSMETGCRTGKGAEFGSVSEGFQSRGIEAGNANGNRFGKDMESCNAVDSSECKGAESGSRVGKSMETGCCIAKGVEFGNVAEGFEGRGIEARNENFCRLDNGMEAGNAAGSHAGKGIEAGSVAGNSDDRDIDAGNPNFAGLDKGMEGGNAADSRGCKGMESRNSAEGRAGMYMLCGNRAIVRIVFPALASLTATVTEARAMDDFLQRYRALGGMLPAESGLPAEAHAYRSGAAVDLDFIPGADAARVASDPLAEGTEMSRERIEGFNAAIDRAFPMTPDMIRRYRQILGESERAAKERPEPRQESSVALVSLEPGEPAPLLRASPSIASVVGFYDSTGAAWPVYQYVLGDGETFEARHLGGKSNNIVVTPAARFGFANLVVLLEGHDRPVSLRLNISEDVADDRFEVHVARPGPLSAPREVASAPKRDVSATDDPFLLAAAEGVDLPPDAEPVEVSGVDARAWLAGGELYLRSRHALMSPAWTGSIAGPDGARVYRIDPVFAALFSVDGRIVRANLLLP